MLEETFDECDDRALAWDKVLLDKQGWSEIEEIYREAIFKTLKAASDADLRLAKSGEQGMLASWAFLFFKSPFKNPTTRLSRGLLIGDRFRIAGRESGERAPLPG